MNMQARRIRRHKASEAYREKYGLTLNGETLTKSEWSERLGLSRGAIAYRLAQGWSVEATLTSPPLSLSERHRKNHGITFNGETLTSVQWAKRLGLSKGAIAARLRRGWSVTEALTIQPVSMREWYRQTHGINFNGETLTTGEWSERLGLSRDAVRKRLDAGWPVEKALTTPLRGRQR